MTTASPIATIVKGRLAPVSGFLVPVEFPLSYPIEQSSSAESFFTVTTNEPIWKLLPVSVEPFLSNVHVNVDVPSEFLVTVPPSVTYSPKSEHLASVIAYPKVNLIVF